jgi:hypothetical protein
MVNAANKDIPRQAQAGDQSAQPPKAPNSLKNGSSRGQHCSYRFSGNNHHLTPGF